MDDTVGVNVKSDLDLRHTSGCRGDSNEVKVTEQLVVGSHFALTLEHLDTHLGLVVGGGRECLGLLGRDGSVTGDESGEDTAKSFNSERQRSDIKKENILDLSLEDSGLDSRTSGNSLVGVDTLARLLAVHALDQCLNSRHSSHTTNQENLAELVLLDARIAQAVLAGRLGALQERLSEAFQLSSVKGQVKMLGTRGVRSDEGKVDLSLDLR